MQANPSEIKSTPNVHWTEYGIPIRNLWHMLLYAWNEYSLKRVWSSEDVENAPTLDALLASILIKLVEQRLRIGLGRNYVDESWTIRGVKGRIDFAASLKARTFERGMVHCEYQQYSANVPKNQIIRSVIARMVYVGNFGPDVAQANELRRRLRWLSRMMNSIDLIELKPDLIVRQQLERNDADYRLMLAICELIIQRQMPSDSDGWDKTPSLDRDAMVLHRIYERFVANFYRMHLTGWAVMPQKHFVWHEKQPNLYMPSMYPDLVLENLASERIVVLDTKFTAQSLIDGQYGKSVFNSSHLYQMYAYLRSQEHLSNAYRAASGILLYPAIQHKLSERIDLQEHTVRIESVDLTLPWQEVERSLLELILAEKVI
jgi:5-methylcytosine-specific restriction enzyme subunit McrC